MLLLFWASPPSQTKNENKVTNFTLVHSRGYATIYGFMIFLAEGTTIKRQE